MVMSRLITKAARSRAARISGLFGMAVAMTVRLDDPTAMRPVSLSLVDMNLFSLWGSRMTLSCRLALVLGPDSGLMWQEPYQTSGLKRQKLFLVLGSGAGL